MNANQFSHQPVLLQETLTALNIKPAGCYLDATFGRGGHSAAILSQLDEQGRLYGLDQDPQAAQSAQERFSTDTRFEFMAGSFADLDELLDLKNKPPQFDGILFDLGVSSPQLDDAARGFSFNQDGPLDMRMDPMHGMPVSAWLAQVEESVLSKVIWEYGEERFSRRIARLVVCEREQQELLRTSQLADLCARAIPRREPGKHPATRTFQALRIYINQELVALEKALPKARDGLKASGHLAVISFHSLEDRMVKRFIRGKPPVGPRRLPVMATAAPSLRAVGKPIRASETELADNPRARSAVLRVAERLQ